MPKCTVFSFVDDLPVVVPEALETRPVVGETLSVGIVRFRAAQGGAIAPKSHFHGEEFSLQLAGGCEVVAQAEIDSAHRGETMSPGTLMVMPAGRPHYGINAFGPEGVSHRFNVVTPPRREYGAKGAETPFYPVGEK